MHRRRIMDIQTAKLEIEEFTNNIKTKIIESKGISKTCVL